MKVSGKKNHRFETAKFGPSQLERSFNLGLKTGLVPSRVWIYEHTFSHISILTRFSSLMKMPATQRWWEYSILWTNPREGRGACLTRGSSPISPGHGTTGRRSSRFFLQGLPLGHTCTNCCPASNSHTISLLLLHLRAFHSVPLPSSGTFTFPTADCRSRQPHICALSDWRDRLDCSRHSGLDCKKRKGLCCARNESCWGVWQHLDTKRLDHVLNTF